MMVSHVVRNRLRTGAWRRLRAPVAIGLLLVASGTRAGAAQLTRGPYLQLLGTTGVTVVWNTDTPAACSVAIRPLDGVASTVAGGTGSVCAVAVGGLQPGTSYAYAPRADGVDLTTESVFHTDHPDARFSFFVSGDSGGADPSQYAVVGRMLASPGDFALHAGDMIYEVGAPQDFDPEFFVPYAPLLRRLVFWPCLGNHDVGTAAGAPWRDAFYVPANNAAGSENYYSFDYGNAHIVVLDSNASTSPGSAEYTFLDQSLAATTKTWKFVAFHHTIYSSGTHGGNTTIRANLVPVFDARHVDIVFMGHDHDYERTKPLHADQAVTPDQGTVYVTSGGGGHSLTPVGTSPFTAYSESTFGFTRVSIDGGGLLLQMIRADGSIADTMTVVKGPTPAPFCGDDLVNQASEQCDGHDQTACVAGCRADCTCAPTCGDGHLNQPDEACDGAADAACPGLCRADCRCGTPAEFLTLAPIADTYVEAGTQATWDHGVSLQLSSDTKPSSIAYLKFDLSGVPAAVVQATLTLACTNASLDGGSVYPVGNSSWIEGDQTGSSSTSAAGAGLKWNDVDTNRDGAIDARDTSPYVPDLAHGFARFGPVAAGQTVSTDVTRGLQSGPGLYTLVIRNDSSDGVTYASRQSGTASQRPRLRLQLGGTITPTTTTTTTSTTTPSSSTTVTLPGPTSTTSTSTTSSSSTSTGAPPASTTTSTTVTSLTLSGVVQADAFVREQEPQTNFGKRTTLEVRTRTALRKSTFLRVAVQGVAGRTVTSAHLRLHVTSASGTTPGARVHAITNCSWSETAVTWATQPAIDGAVLASAANLPAGATADFDVTAAIAGDGVYCFALDGTGNGPVVYAARESATPPALVVQVAP